MAFDTQLTVYKATDKDSGKSRGSGYQKPDRAKCDEAYRKWKLRKAQGAFDLKKFLCNGDNSQIENKKQ